MNLKNIAVLFSMLGSVMIAGTDPKQRIIAGVIWFVANTIWLHYSMKAKDAHQSLLWVFYNLTSILTIYNNINLL